MIRNRMILIEKKYIVYFDLNNVGYIKHHRKRSPEWHQ